MTMHRQMRCLEYNSRRAVSWAMQRESIPDDLLHGQRWLSHCRGTHSRRADSAKIIAVDHCCPVAVYALLLGLLPGLSNSCCDGKAPRGRRLKKPPWQLADEAPSIINQFGQDPVRHVAYRSKWEVWLRPQGQWSEVTKPELRAFFGGIGIQALGDYSAWGHRDAIVDALRNVVGTFAESPGNTVIQMLSQRGIGEEDPLLRCLAGEQAAVGALGGGGSQGVMVRVWARIEMRDGLERRLTITVNELQRAPDGNANVLPGQRATLNAIRQSLRGAASGSEVRVEVRSSDDEYTFRASLASRREGDQSSVIETPAGALSGHWNTAGTRFYADGLGLLEVHDPSWPRKTKGNESKTALLRVTIDRLMINGVDRTIHGVEERQSRT